VRSVDNWGGSSGLLAVTAALTFKPSHVVCVGIPLDFDQGHYDEPHKKWRDGSNYRKGWVNHKKELATSAP